MVEPIMYMAIGFLVSMLIGLMIFPLVHNRAVRLTTKRLEAAAPVSRAEIQADKDQLRAEFAVNARRLELTIEQLKSKATGQLAELGKKTDAVNRLKIELGEKSAILRCRRASRNCNTSCGRRPTRHRRSRSRSCPPSRRWANARMSWRG